VKATVNVKHLIEEMELLEKAVADKPPQPILSHVLVQAIADANNPGLRLATTDLTIGLVTFCPGEVPTQGSCTLPVKHLLDILRLLPEPDISISLEGRGVRLVSGRYDSKLQTYPASGYVSLPTMKDLPVMVLPGPDLLKAIRQVRFAVAPSGKNKYLLDGANAVFTAESMVLVATDSHRLAVTKMLGEFGVHKPIIFPARTLDTLTSLLTTTQGDVKFAYTAAHLFFAVSGRVLFSGRIDGDYPTYERMIPVGYTDCLEVDPVKMMDAVRRMVLTDQELSMSLANNLLTMTSKHKDLGEVVEQLDVNYTGPDATFKVHGEYLLEYLRVMTPESRCILSWKAGRTALLFTESENYIYVLMQRR
jgi:DNA polymerase III subunit beta